MCAKLVLPDGATSMTREQFLQKLRRYARKANLAIDIDARRGKGAHYIVRLGGNWTTVQSDLTPLTIQRCCKQLGIDPADL